MRVLICYDIASSTTDGARRLRRVAKACQNHGQRVQYSLFEVNTSDAGWVQLRERLLSLFDEEEDSLRFYFLPSGHEERSEHHGVRAPIDFGGALII